MLVYKYILNEACTISLVCLLCFFICLSYACFEILPRVSLVNNQRAKEIMVGAVDERLNTIVIEKQRSSPTKPCSEITNGSWKNEIVNIAVDAQLNVVSLKQQRSSTTKPCFEIANGSRANEIVTDTAHPRLNVIDDMLDSGSDMRDEDADTLDTWNNIRDEDADLLDSDGNGDMQIVEDQSSTDSNKDANIFDVDGDADMDQSLPTIFKKVSGSSRKRKRDKVRRQVTYPHSEFKQHKLHR